MSETLRESLDDERREAMRLRAEVAKIKSERNIAQAQVVALRRRVFGLRDVFDGIYREHDQMREVAARELALLRHCADEFTMSANDRALLRWWIEDPTRMVAEDGEAFPGRVKRARLDIQASFPRLAFAKAQPEQDAAMNPLSEFATL